MSLLTLMKGQPLAYNKDNQEDKEPLFDAIDTLTDCLTAMLGLVPAIEVRAATLREAALQGYTTATDLADYLVRRNVPFRDAHEIVGRTVGYAVAAGRSLESLSLRELQQFGGDAIDASVAEALTLEGSVNARNHFGATAPAQVRAALERARARL
jgi:argininosuccinate lyase